jgi:DNA-binding NarL/FixJ family response regulator
MLSALRLVLAGGVYLPPDLLEPMTPGSTATGTNAGEVMTERQREVLRLLVGGKSNKQIGTALDISESTVRVHVTALFRILGVSNRTEASYAARRLRWLD